MARKCDCFNVFKANANERALTYWTALPEAARGSSPGVSCPRPQRASGSLGPGSLDGGTEAVGTDLRAGLAAAVPAGVRWRGQGGGAPVEPARPWGRQRRGSVPGPPPGPGEPVPLERQGEAMTPPRRRPPVPAGRALGALRPPPPRRPRRPLRGHLIPATPPPPAAAISHRCDRFGPRAPAVSDPSSVISS
ncbi:hypothetical protein B296_00016569 [Ensete ventricosum]|uniref:Uncharacterized protein n=1 Tax=Ensete ventricosum TaxID=4639 RepID=A0A427AKB5_ENSVE|nr:hypothetical protein B296_00016569 [Ensete ventricosum]